MPGIHFSKRLSPAQEKHLSLLHRAIYGQTIRSHFSNWLDIAVIDRVQINMQIHPLALQMNNQSILNAQASCWPLQQNSMKTLSQVPSLSCSQGKPISTISAAWLPVNNMTHKLIMPISLLPCFPPCCLVLSPTPSLSCLPPLLPGVLLAFHLQLTHSNRDHT